MKTIMRGLLGGKCKTCLGNLYLDLYADKGSEAKCIMCGRPAEVEEVPDFILAVVKHWKKKGAHKKVKDLR